MPQFTLSDLSPALPEILLVATAMALLILGAFRGEGSTRFVSWLGVAALIIVLVVAQLGGGERRVGFYGMFVTDAFALFMKSLVLAGSAVTILMGMRYNEEQGIARFEFPVLVMLATTGMMVMISANDLITLYVGLELQNLALYVVASFARDSARSSEAGLKYFVLGGLSSGMLLYGVVAGLWLCRHDRFCRSRQAAGRRSAGLAGADRRSRFHYRGPRLQDLGGAVPYVDA